MNQEFRADLHCHSNFSDGTDTPMQLLHKAIEVGLQGLSITDHDTIDAYTPELFEEAKKINLALLPGVEISSELDCLSVHVLGYGYDLSDRSLRDFLVEMQGKRGERNRAILIKLASYNMPITEEELQNFAKLRTIGRPHIAQLMVLKGYVGSIQEAFEKYLKEGALCYTSGIRFHPKDVIEEIHKAKGKAVLAHPHFIKKRNLVKKLLDLPFDGIECHYAKLDKSYEVPWVKVAKDKGWIATGGSDYHGDLKPQIPLGCSWVSKAVFDNLRNPK